MKKIISILFLFQIIYANAQTSLVWGNVFTSPKKHLYNGLLGDPVHGYVSFNEQYGKSLVLQKFGTDLNYQTETLVDLKVMPSGYINEEFMTIKGKHYWFYSKWIKPGYFEQLEVQQIDIENSKVIGEPKLLLKSVDKLKGDLTMTGFFQYNKKNKWNFEVSNDSSKILIHYNLEYEQDVIGLQVFDDNCNKVWGDTFKLPYSHSLIDVLKYHVNKDGEVLLLCKVYENYKVENEDGKPNYHYEIYKYTSDSKEPKTISFKLESKYVTDIMFRQLLNGDIFIVGYYSDKIRKTITEYSLSGVNNRTVKSSVDGVFCAKLTSFSDVTESSFTYNEFPAELIKSFEKNRISRRVERKEDKDENEISKLILKDLFINEDGSIDIFGEEFNEFKHKIHDARGSIVGESFNYTYGDIYLMRLNPNLSYHSSLKVPKYQFKVIELNTSNGFGQYTSNLFIPTEKVYSLSYAINKSGNSYYLYFYDDVNNVINAIDESPKKFNDGEGGALMEVKISTDDSIVKKALFDVKTEKFFIKLSELKRIDENKMVGLAYTFTNGPFAYLTVNERDKRFLQINIKN